MSALTDLFTALANKIRSKTGGSTTYTPPQMVNAIDDVYDAGVAAGTPTLTGNATASDVMSGKTFYNNSTTKQTGSYVAPTITSITPSNTSPASMSANNNYKPSSSGYAISSYDSVTPSSSGTYFSSGMKKMASSGYAYSSRPQMSETTLWTNTSPTTSFGIGSVTLSQSMRNFSFIKIYWRVSTSNANTSTFTITVDDLIRTTSGVFPQFLQGFGYRSASGQNMSIRCVYYKTDTEIGFGGSGIIGASGGSNSNNVPVKITGII